VAHDAIVANVRQHDHRQVFRGRRLAQQLQHLDAAHRRHLDVQQDERELLAPISCSACTPSAHSEMVHGKCWVSIL
jgi:hypothetical protein